MALRMKPVRGQKIILETISRIYRTRLEFDYFQMGLVTFNRLLRNVMPLSVLIACSAPSSLTKFTKP